MINPYRSFATTSGQHLQGSRNQQQHLTEGLTYFAAKTWNRPFYIPAMRFIIKNIKKVKVKWSRYRPGVAQRVGRGIALLFHNRGTRRGWVVSSTPRPHFTPGKELVPILQEAVWDPGPIWTGGKSRPHRDSIPDRPARSQLLYQLSYPGHYQE